MMAQITSTGMHACTQSQHSRKCIVCLQAKVRAPADGMLRHWFKAYPAKHQRKKKVGFRKTKWQEIHVTVPAKSACCNALCTRQFKPAQTLRKYADAPACCG